MNEEKSKKFDQKYCDSAIKLGVALQELIAKQLQQRRQITESVEYAWSELLPGHLAQHCKVSELKAGQLKVAVDSPCYIYELNLCSSGLLSELQKRSPQARIKEIKFAIG
jgi:predicted nucleic acid-binding Zn ribbon protein